MFQNISKIKNMLAAWPSDLKRYFYGDRVITIAWSWSLTLVVVVLPDPFRGTGAWRNSTETRPEIKNGRSGAKDGAPERLGCGTVKEEVSRILQRVSAGFDPRRTRCCVLG